MTDPVLTGVPACAPSLMTRRGFLAGSQEPGHVWQLLGLLHRGAPTLAPRPARLDGGWCCWQVSLEGQVARKQGNLTSFSEQDLVDCVKNVKLPGNDQVCCDGCQGGLMDYAFRCPTRPNQAGGDCHAWEVHDRQAKRQR